jgi:type I restriction enzyme, S subunit
VTAPDFHDNLPPGWVQGAAAEVCEKIQDGTHFSPKVQLSEGRYAYVTAKNVRPWGLDLAGLTFLREQDHRAIYARCDCRKGDVLLVKDGVNTGDVALNTLDGEISLLSSVCMLRPDPRILRAGFLRYYLQSPQGSHSLTGRMSGTAIRRIILTRIKETPIRLCPVSAQDRIVASLESYLTCLEDAAATLERVQRNLKRYRASVLKAAVEGRLVPTEAELARAEGRDYEPASALLGRILAERRRRWEEAGLARMKAKGQVPKDHRWKARYREPIPPDTSGLPELPGGWCWTTLGALVVSGPQNGIYVPQSRYGRGTPILRISDFQLDKSRSSTQLRQVGIPPSEVREYSLRVGDLVVNRVNSPSHLGKTLAILQRHVPAVFESNMMRLEVSNRVVPAYVQHYLSSGAGKRRLTEGAKWAVNQASINQQDVARTPVPLPPTAEQERIVAEVDRLDSLRRESQDVAAQSAERIRSLRQAFLKWAFEGKLVEQDPNDESASVLLERIRAARAEAGGQKPAKRQRRIRKEG